MGGGLMGDRNVWLIAEGQYSDYGILAVTTGSKAHAEAVAARIQEHKGHWAHPYVFVQRVDRYDEGEFPEPLEFHVWSWLRLGPQGRIQSESRSVSVLPFDAANVTNQGAYPTAKKPLLVKVSRNWGSKGDRRVDVAALDFHTGQAAFDAAVAKIVGAER
jgi:hypothetical protein